MVVFLSVIQFLCIVVIMVLEFNKKSPAVFFVGHGLSDVRRHAHGILHRRDQCLLGRGFE